MQTTRIGYLIICEKCGKPAARCEIRGTKLRYLHFTKKGSVWHELSIDPGDKVQYPTAADGQALMPLE